MRLFIFFLGIYLISPAQAYLSPPGKGKDPSFYEYGILSPSNKKQHVIFSTRYAEYTLKRQPSMILNPIAYKMMNKAKRQVRLELKASHIAEARLNIKKETR